MIATALVAQHGDELGKASGLRTGCGLLQCRPCPAPPCKLQPAFWVSTAGLGCRDHCMHGPMAWPGSSSSAVPTSCLLQVTAVAGSAGGQDATPPSDLATAVLTSPNSTEVQRLALGYPLSTPAGVSAGCSGWAGACGCRCGAEGQ